MHPDLPSRKGALGPFSCRSRLFYLHQSLVQKLIKAPDNNSNNNDDDDDDLHFIWRKFNVRLRRVGGGGGGFEGFERTPFGGQ